jgi:glucan phosphoethanolaminetransferase (alkaline phosphatase superfamily)
MIPFVQPERAQIAAGKIDYMFSYENFVHEAGFGRLGISIVTLLILLIPFRRREPWAFAALAILAVVYFVPVFLFGAIPNLGTWPVFHTWHLPQPRVANLVLVYWSSIVFVAFLILGLAMSTPAFFRRKGH